MNADAPRPWFPPERQASLRDFWTVYQRHHETLRVATLRVVEQHETLAPLLRAMSPEQLAAEDALSRELMRRCFEDGEWQSYEANLRMQGVFYARMGLRFSTWFDLITAVRADLVRHLVEAYGAEPPRLIGAMVVFSDFLDRTMTTVAEMYMHTTEELMRAAEARSAELVEHSRRTEEANRLKSEFLANMSHELRTPLNAILGFAELLHDGRVGPLAPRQIEFLAHILRSGRHLLQLINDVLDLAKVEAGKMEFHPELLHLEAVCAEVVATLAGLADSKRITVALEVSPALGQVELDAGRLKQVLYNLVSNALKFTPEGGRVVVRCAPEGEGELRLEVEDTGIGIAPDQLGLLFSDFEQLDAGSAKGHPGTGLGLALTRKLAAAQGGRVGVRSALGRGSTFHAILPRRRPADVRGEPSEVSRGG